MLKHFLQLFGGLSLFDIVSFGIRPLYSKTHGLLWVSTNIRFSDEMICVKRQFAIKNLKHFYFRFSFRPIPVLKQYQVYVYWPLRNWYCRLLSHICETISIFVKHVVLSVKKTSVIKCSLLVHVYITHAEKEICLESSHTYGWCEAHWCKLTADVWLIWDQSSSSATVGFFS